MAHSVTWLPSASRTTTQTSPDIETQSARSLTVTLDVTNVAAAPSVTLTINRKDPASGKYLLMLSGVAVLTAITSTYKITPGEIAAAANVSAIDVIPEWIQIVVTANNANACTYSVDYELEDISF